jgi:hypothetical protein
MEELSGISLSPGGTPGLFSEKNYLATIAQKISGLLKSFLAIFKKDFLYCFKISDYFQNITPRS